MKKTPKRPVVSCIVATHNGEKFITRCLSSLLESKGDLIEVIVVDDHSDDSTQSRVKAFAHDARVSYIRLSKKMGAAYARNTGAHTARGDYLFFLDDDTKITSGYEKQIAPFFKKHKNTGVALVKLLSINTNKYDSAGELISPFGFLSERAQGVTDTGQFDTPDRIFSGKSAGMIIRRDVFQKLGGFDTDFNIFWEDTDLCWRAWLFGYNVRFLHRITVYHAFWTDEKDKQVYIKNRVTYHGCRNMIESMIKNFSILSLITRLPVVIGAWSILSLLFLVKGDFFRFAEIIRGQVSLVLHIPHLFNKRKHIQKNRAISDTRLFKTVGTKKPFYYFLYKARAYITQKAY